MTTLEDEDLLLALLNSAPVLDGVPTERLAGAEGTALAAGFGGTGSAAEIAALRDTRQALHDAIRGRPGAHGRLDGRLESATWRPEADEDGVRWTLRTPADERLAVRAVLAWSRVVSRLPGRLRPCANAECNLFLVDHSRPGTARWCSMATCGNRMKARTHARRTRGASEDGP